MTSGIRVELQVERPAECPIAQLSAESGGSCHSISRSRAPGGDTVTEEFVLDREVSADRDVEEVFSYGDRDVYRFERETGQGCPCEQIEQFGCPVVDLYTDGGVLHLAFHAADMDQLRTIVRSVRDTYEDVNVQRLLRSCEDAADQDLVFVDRSALTDRQLEVLRTAHEMGYFRYPKGANASEVADALDISTSTFTEHLSAAQEKLLDAVLARRH